MSKEGCATCRFWDRYTESALGKKLGDCRRRPPVVSETLLSRFMIAPSYRQAASSELEMELDLHPASAFPVTHQTSWCGEHDDGETKAPWPC